MRALMTRPALALALGAALLAPQAASAAVFEVGCNAVLEMHTVKQASAPHVANLYAEHPRGCAGEIALESLPNERRASFVDAVIDAIEPPACPAGSRALGVRTGGVEDISEVVSSVNFRRAYTLSIRQLCALEGAAD
ncbi:hypothetical protein J2T57_001660 [Natronocella acetinitrilica]|uniref:Secreted protein n=1 Tax=Natronocella acetinitrilica TaxID=414046 RepID=A0AAE3G3L1_9GAMM|nr:hypothetical protein [Natronocella acetinitrilica]MCP1674558.1 hypothetical protein [Natronocella acetinitrilica]